MIVSFYKLGEDISITIDHKDFKKQKTTIMQAVKDAVIRTASKLLVANNKLTTLELKTELRKAEPAFYWSQATVSAAMDELAQKGMFVYTDNGTFRTYSDPTIKIPKVKNQVVKQTVKKAGTGSAPRISRTKALDLMQNNKGHFFTATFIKKDGTERTINCQYAKTQPHLGLGLVTVKEASKLKVDPKDSTRQININTLRALKIAGQLYKIRN